MHVKNLVESRAKLGGRWDKMLTQGKIIAHQILGDPQYKIRKLVLETDIAERALPGQFVHIQVAKGLDPLLRRPFSIADMDPKAGTITLLYRIKGKGTEILAQALVGETLSVMGPLGTGFTIPEEGELILVAGGIGSFPLLPLAKAAQEKKIPCKFYWGGENIGFFNSAGLELWEKREIPVFLSSLDGSAGVKGNALDLLNEELLGEKALGRDFQGQALKGYSAALCGPQGMLKSVCHVLLDAGADVEVSLEERMGCAIGACLGCVCTLQDETGKVYRGKVCTDGPVFKGKEVLWDYEG